MIKDIIQKLENKNVAILGFGREGKATYKFIRKYIPNMYLTIIDRNDVRGDQVIENDENLGFIYGEDYLATLSDFDLVIKTPGISLKDVDVTKINITSEIELLLEVARDRVIGVTGTKGKSTTSSLIYNILKVNGKDALLAGNIGVPVFDLIEDIKEDTLIVIEMSSHQLEFLNVSPHIGVVLNLFEDHLDHAGSVEHYHDIKMKMFSNQSAQDFMIFSKDNAILRKKVEESHYKGQVYDVSAEDKATTYLENGAVYYNGRLVFDTSLDRKLLGKHNFFNIMVAYTVSKILDLNDEKTFEAIKEFDSLSYRLEYIGDVDGVKYYVDTLATIPLATLEAIEAIPDVDTLIFGGMDRGISYEGFALELKKSNVGHFICMPITGHIIGRELPEDRVYFVQTLEEACELAKKVTTKGKACVLSPAAASYDQFKNYADKGDKYKEYILVK